MKVSILLPCVMSGTQVFSFPSLGVTGCSEGCTIVKLNDMIHFIIYMIIWHKLYFHSENF